MSGWWRRNRIALAALAVLLPITAATLVGVAWARYYAYEPTIPRDPGTDGTVELADADWGPVRAKDLTGGEGLIAPADSRVIGVAVPVDPHGEPPRCSSPTLVEQSTGRRWEHMTYDLGFEYSSDEHTFCASPEEDEDFEFMLRVSELTALDVDDVDLDGGAVRVLGKGGKEREVPIGRHARDAISSYLTRARPSLAAVRSGGALFLNRRGGRLTRQSCARLLASHVDRAGIDRHVTLHGLRHVDTSSPTSGPRAARDP